MWSRRTDSNLRRSEKNVWKLLTNSNGDLNTSRAWSFSVVQIKQVPVTDSLIKSSAAMENTDFLIWHDFKNVK